MQNQLESQSGTSQLPRCNCGVQATRVHGGASVALRAQVLLNLMGLDLAQVLHMSREFNHLLAKGPIIDTQVCNANQCFWLQRKQIKQTNRGFII